MRRARVPNSILRLGFARFSCPIALSTNHSWEKAVVLSRNRACRAGRVALVCSDASFFNSCLTIEVHPTHLELFAMYRLFVAGLLLGAAVQANAIGSVVNAKVVQVRIDSNGAGMVIFDQPIGGTPPGCVIPYYANALAFNGSAGKQIMALALFAKATNSPLSNVYGTGSCSSYGSYVEDWGYGQ
jgi:hypothetical protein